MRDDRHRWAVPADRSVIKEIGGATLQEVMPARQTLISGIAVRETEAPLIAWPDVVITERYSLSLRRDRVLIVNGPPMADGWSDKTQRAVSDMTDGYRMFDLRGKTALQALQRGAEIDLSTPSASVARQLFGMNCLIYRIDHPTDYRIHVARAQGDALWDHIIVATQAAFAS